MRAALLAACLAVGGCNACDRAPTPPPGPVPGSGSAPDVSDAEIDAVGAQLAVYAEQLTPLSLDFDGNCQAFATKLLALEPLAQSIREHSAGLVARGVPRDAIEQRFRNRTGETLAKIDAALAARGKTRADVEANDTLVRDRCANEPAVHDAMDRIGVMKRN